MALQWSVANALTRPGSPPADSVDLLVGIMLTHLRDSPPRHLLEHFDIPLGAVVRREGIQPPNSEALLTAVGGLAPDQPPLVGPEVERALSYASSVLPQEADGLISLNMLFGALLSPRVGVSDVLRAQLTTRGVNADTVLGSYPDFLTRRESYADFLKTHHPYRPRAVELPTYSPDQPRERRPPPDSVPDPADLVGIEAEVNAFAYLIASKNLVPPLAVGLFGDWGSGKSYFLRSVQRRVDELIGDKAAASRPSETLPFYKSIVQIEYNAWQYIEGDLWSSLLEHLFRNLTPVNEVDDNLLAQRQRAIIEHLRQTGDKHDAALLQRSQVEDELRVATAEVRRRTQEREVKLAELERQRREQRPHELINKALRETVKEIAQQVGLDATATKAENFRSELIQTAETLRSTGPMLAFLQRGGLKAAAAVLILLALTPGVAWLLGHVDVSAVVAWAGTVATLLGTVAGYIGISNRFLTKQLKKYADAQAGFDEKFTEEQKKLDQKLAKARNELDDVEIKLNKAADAERKLAAEAAALEVQLAETTPSRVLSEFISERLGSDDYRSRLGVPALVRRDLARLSMLIQQLHATGASTAEQGIDRIVLYIDDLDRCPTQLVVDVLQAVHLLLAFPLFVVVVAVDSRWLTHSLRHHYRQLEGTDAAPEDFIEKIFQVPFWVRPLDPVTRQRMVRELVSPSPVASTTADSTAQVDAGPDISAADLPAFRRLVASFADTAGVDPPWLEAVTLTVSTDELAWIERAAPLLGDTPRAVKRFANVYLLLRSVGRGHGWPLPDGGQVVVLLALATGLPRLADVMLPVIEQAREATFELERAVPKEPGELETDKDPGWASQREMFHQWLDQDQQARTMNVAGLASWIDLIHRFRFRR
jgi:KAP family P-loop domain